MGSNAWKVEDIPSEGLTTPTAPVVIAKPTSSDVVGWKIEDPQVEEQRPSADWSKIFSSIPALSAMNPLLGVGVGAYRAVKDMTKDEGLSLARGLTPALGLGVGAATIASAPVTIPTLIAGTTIGGLTYMAADRMLQQQMSVKPTTFSWNPITPSSKDINANSAEQLLANEFGGRAVSKVMSGLRAVVKEMKVPGSITGEISNLLPTYSQIRQALTGEVPVSKLIEDIFAAKAKTQAIEKSASLGMNEGDILAQQLSGRTSAQLSSREAKADFIQRDAITSKAAYQLESNMQSNIVKGIAKTPDIIQNGIKVPGNIVQIPNAVQPTSLTLPGNPTTRSIEGPISLDNTIEAAQRYLLEKQKIFGDVTKNISLMPPKDQKLVNAALQLHRAANVTLDVHTGDILSHDPISFEDAWQFKQALGDLYTKNPQSTVLFRTINDDIANSIKTWPNKPGEALKAWENAKDTVEQRILLHGAKGLKNLINTTDSAIPEVESILKDPKKLDRALTTGNTTFLSGRKSSTSIREDLQGYDIKRSLEDSWIVDPNDATKMKFDANKLMDKTNDPGMKDSYNLLYSSAEREARDKLFKNLAITQQRQTSLGNYAKLVWPARGGLALAGGLASQQLGGSFFYGAGITSIILSGTAVANILVKPGAARVLAALAEGHKLGSDQFMSRLIFGALQGTGSAITLKSRNKDMTGTIDSKGEFVPESTSAPQDTQSLPN
jgi:hypothetical protein